MHHARIAFEQRAFEIDAFFTHYCYRIGDDWGPLYRAIFAICRQRLSSWSSDHADSETTVHDLTATVIGDIYSAMLKADLESMDHAYNYARKAAKSKAFEHRASYEAIALKSKRDQADFKQRLIDDTGKIVWRRPRPKPEYAHLSESELDQLISVEWWLAPQASVSLSTPLLDDTEGNDTETLQDTLEDENSDHASAYERTEETSQRFADAMSILSPSEQQFLETVLKHERVIVLQDQAEDEIDLGDDIAWTRAAEDHLPQSKDHAAYGRKMKERIREKLEEQKK